MADKSGVDAFIERWRGVTGSERANYQLFIAGLCDLLDVPTPEPAHEDTRDNAYVFERRVTFAHGDGSASAGFIDCYRRGAFVLEAKRVKASAQTKGFDDALMRARAQAESYARALPSAEGRPPFVVTVDVGHVIELYAEFTRSGATYTPFPDARSHRIALADLAKSEVRERLRALWLDPLSLDPSRASAKVTREVAVQLAQVARSLEATGHAPQRVAAFLTRCLFSMFAEDVGLLPPTADGEGAFVALLKRHAGDPATLARMLRALWADMDRGGFSAALARDVLRFNGKLFKGSADDGYVLPLARDQIEGLLGAARANWREVEPAIFGTLLERALDPAERHALGAHYTPRAYVERLVLPTVVEPLRADWANAQAAALLLATEANTLEGKKREDKLSEARAEVRRFHHALCTVRVLDPACGSGNFLYVTLEHLKRLEGEVLDQLQALGEAQSRLGLEGETVTLQQLRGIEINERAAALAELVLWIGFLQWHIRTFGHASVAEPVIHDYKNIECRDAVLAYDEALPLLDDADRVVTRWDGETFKRHPVTGDQVPDEAARRPLWRYTNARQASWPEAEFIVGNPPFIGNKRMRDALGDGYAQALRAAWPEVPESADFVMYWWQRAAQTVARHSARRFGLITTNSVTMIFNRRVVDAALSGSTPIALAFAIPNHPWVDSAKGAAVRIAMTVGTTDAHEPRLLAVRGEAEGADGEATVELEERRATIHADLSVGANVAATKRLQANSGLSFMGMIALGGERGQPGFWVDHKTAAAIGLGTVPGLDTHVRSYCNGRDLTGVPRNLFALDFYGLEEDEVRTRFPAAYQLLRDRVYLSRQQDRRESYRRLWWQFAEPRARLRTALVGLRRFIATVETAKHRTFVFLDTSVMPDQKLRAIAADDASMLGLLSSVVHLEWAPRAGGNLGVGDDPVYNNTRCFEPFPFPSDDTGLTPTLTARIAILAEELDAHRKRQQAAHAGLTLTGMYNVLDKLRREEPLSAQDKLIHEQGLVSVLRTLHDEVDAVVLAAYGWADLQSALADHRPAVAEARAAAVDALLEKLVALNTKRAAEEATGTVRWLRPEYQQRDVAAESGTGMQSEIEVDTEQPAVAGIVAVPPARRPWPAGLPEQIKAVAELLAAQPRALTLAEIESGFTARGRWRDRLPVILTTLEALARARRSADGSERWQAV